MASHFLWLIEQLPLSLKHYQRANKKRHGQTDEQEQFEMDN